jgi:hypothetical protein
MEEEITRRHERNAINGNKITIIRFHTNVMSPFRGFDHRRFDQRKNFNHCSETRNPKILKSGFETFGSLRRSEIALLATKIQDFRWLRDPCFQLVSCRIAYFFLVDKLPQQKTSFLSHGESILHAQMVN